MRSLSSGVMAIALLGAALASGCKPKDADVDLAAAKDLRITVGGGLEVPESALYDAESDIILVSNINGSPFGTDGAGFISRVRPDGSIEALKWIDGKAEGIDLDAPKGMAIAGEVLFVADVRVVRKFDRKTGKPLGSIAIEGASFLNDLAAASDFTVFVSDTGLGEGFVATGTDAVYAILPSGEVRTVAKGKDLGQPNGLLADGDAVVVVSWEGGTLKIFDREGKGAEIAKLPANQLDGVVRAKDGGWLVSSWAGSCVYAVSPDGTWRPAIEKLAAPADLGYDTKRGRLLIPLFNDRQLLMTPVPAP